MAGAREFDLLWRAQNMLPLRNDVMEEHYRRREKEIPRATLRALDEDQEKNLQEVADKLTQQNIKDMFLTSKYVQTSQRCTDLMASIMHKELEEFKDVPLFVNNEVPVSSVSGITSTPWTNQSNGRGTSTRQPPSVHSNAGTATPWHNQTSRVTTKQPLNSYGRCNDRQTATKRKNEDQENDMETSPVPSKTSDFRTAREQLIRNQKKKNQQSSSSSEYSGSGFSVKKSLGARPRVPGKNKFVPPSSNNEQERSPGTGTSRMSSTHSVQHGTNNVQMDEDINPRLQGIDSKIIEMISNEIMLVGNKVEWDDIAGLQFVKQMIEEIIIWPMQRPDLFTGLTKPAKGILLFGPPGTGKTLIGKCIANQSGATFFSISASSLTSKWIGEGEKMVRGLFAVAGCHQPAVIFIDEIDSLLTQRSDTEHESSRRMKTEFLVQLDGATTDSDDQILVIGATNRPQELDEAARRRLEKRLYIPLPDGTARKQIVERLLSKHRHSLTPSDLDGIVSLTDGYSGADMACLCKESAMCPLRCIRSIGVQSIRPDDVRPICLDDFEKSIKRVRPTVSQDGVHFYEEWNKQFGCSDL